MNRYIKASRIVLALLITSLFSHSTWAGTFTLDFNDEKDHGARRWGNNTDQPNGNWTALEGAYLIEATEAWAGAFWGDLNWADYTVSVRARSTSGTGCVAITVRVKDPLNYSLWVLDVKGNQLAWVRGIDGEFLHQTVDPAPGNALDEHVFKVVVSSNRFEGYFDGELIREWTDDLYPTGSIGIGVGCGKGTEAVFDDLVISGDGVPDLNPDSNLTSVTPKNRLSTTWAKLKIGN